MHTSNPPSRKQELLGRLQHLCPMSCKTHVLHKRDVRIWTACDLDPLLEELERKPDDDPAIIDEQMPYWAELWPAGLALATCILDPRHSRPPGPWLELGCGPGMAGIAAALSGSPGVCTDYQQEAIWLAELNAIENGIDNLSASLLDWRRPPGDQTYPWILASDITYEERNFQPLLDCFETLLAPGGEIWFAEPGRSIAKPFYDQLFENGWMRHRICHRKPMNIQRLRRAPARP